LTLGELAFPCEGDIEMPNPVVHFEVTGKDAKKLQNFYQKALGWSMQDAGND
jgi:predicted enzyme related to lactoylglutathione lyase